MVNVGAIGEYYCIAHTHTYVNDIVSYSYKIDLYYPVYCCTVCMCGSVHTGCDIMRVFYLWAMDGGFI